MKTLHAKPGVSDLVLCVLLGQGLAVSIWAFFLVFSFLQPFDDEGYFLIGYKLFVEGQQLFQDIFTQYGPVPYLVRWSLHWLFGFPISHDAGRVLALCFWLMATAACTISALKLARSVLAAQLAMLTCFVLMSSLCNGPGHPQEICLVLLSTATVLMTSTAQRSGQTLVCGFAGIHGGLLLLTKINIGVFYLMALGATIFSLGPRSGPLRALGWVYFVLMFLAPVVLITPWSGPAWANKILLVELTSLVTVMGLALANREASTRFGPTSLLSAGIGTAAVVVVVGLVLRARGMPVASYLDGTFLNGLRLASTFTYCNAILDMPPRFYLPAFLAPVLALYARRMPADDRRAALVLSIVRALGGLTILALFFHNAWTYDYLSMILLGPPTVALLLVRPIDRSRPTGETTGRTFLAFLAVTELLWVYPVPGDQLAFASYLTSLCVCIYTADGVNDLLALAKTHGPGSEIKFIPLLKVISSLCIGFVCFLGARHASKVYYDKLVPLRLPGMHLIRVPEGQRQEVEGLVDYLRKKSGTFFSMPGLSSLYFWTEKPPVTGLNNTAWMLTFSEQQQRKVIHSLEENGVLMLVVAPDLVEYWQRPVPPPKCRILVRWIEQHFHPALRIGDYFVYTKIGELDLHSRPWVIGGESLATGRTWWAEPQARVELPASPSLSARCTPIRSLPAAKMVK
jgi:hypothetical protein